MKKAQIVLLGYFILFSINDFSAQGNSFYGEFVVRKVLTSYDSLNAFTNYIAYSNLYADSVETNESWHSGNFGNVVFNGIGLNYNDIIKTYHDTVQRTSNEEMEWIFLSTSGALASFTANCLDTFPNIQNINIIPDTLKKSDSLYIHFGEITNVDEIELTMFDGVLRIDPPFNRAMQVSNQFVSVPAADLSTLEGEAVTLTLGMIKYEYKILSGKRFRFQKRYNIVKTLRLVN
jgi:hypothetical protein